MADPKASDLEEIKKASMQLGLSAQEAQKFVDALAKSSRDVVEATKMQYEQLVKNKQLIQETKDLSDLQYSNNVRISEEAKKTLEERREILKKIEEQQVELLKLETEIVALQQKKQELGQNFSTEDEEKLKNLLQQKEAAEQIKKIDEQDLEVLQDQLTVLGKHEQLHKNIIADLENELASLTGMSGVWRSIQSGASISGALFAQFAANAGRLLETVNQGNAEFARTTGQIADRTANFGYGLSQFGIGFKELNKASADLYVSMSNFSKLNKDTQKDLAESAAKMELLGVSAQTTGQLMNDFTKSLRMSSDEARQTNEYLARAAIGMGIPPQKMASEFAAAAPKMAAYGKQGVEVFISLEKQAKSLGMQMNTLMGIVGDTFDTFEGGAKAAGKLNAILGGDYLNSVEMLNATESERIEILKRSFDMSGKNWDSLDRFEKKAIAASLGISDLNEASKLFGNSTAELTEDMQAQAVSQEKLEAVQREAVTVQKKMTEIFNALLIAVRPIVWIIEKLVNAFTMANDETGGWLGGIIAAVSGVLFLGVSFAKLLGPMRSFVGMVTGLPAKLSAMRAAMMAAGGGFGGLKAGLTSLFGGGGAPAPPNVPVPNVPPTNPAAAFSFKRFMIGIRDGLAAWASPQGVKAIIGAGVFAIAATLISTPLMLIGYMIAQKMIEPAGVLMFTAGLLLLSVAMKIISTIATPELIVGALFFTIAAGILSLGLMAMASVMKVFNGIDFEQVLKGLGVIALLTAAIFGLGAILMNPVGLALFAVGIGGFIGLSIAIAALGLALQVLSPGLEALSKFNESLAGLAGIKDAGSVAAEAIYSMSEALEELPTDKTVTLNALNQVLTTAKTITEEQIKPSKDFIETVRQYYLAQGSAKEADKDAIVQALKEIKKVITDGQQSGGSSPVKLVLSDGSTLNGKMSNARTSDFINGGNV